MVMAGGRLEAASGQIQQTKGLFAASARRTADQGRTLARNAGTVALREIERSKCPSKAIAAQSPQSKPQKGCRDEVVDIAASRKGEREAQLQQAQVDLDKTVVYAGVGAGWSSSC